MTPHQKNDVPYNQIDHRHCWTSKNPPCGQKIEHLKCCLCEKLNPRIETLLTQQAERIAEEVEDLRMEYDPHNPRTFLFFDPVAVDGYNVALDDVLTVIRKK